MERRTFMQITGAAAASAAWGRGAAAARNTQESLQMGIDAEQVRARNQNRSTVCCRGGIVSTSQPLATMAGVDILKAGGNAIDAAVCANAMLGLTEPMNCGIGGDLFAIVWSERDQRLFGLNASGRSPYAWSLEAARELGIDKIPSYSPLAWSVPGCVSGWDALLGRFGKTPLAQLLAPAIHYAREGFVLGPIAADDWGFDPGKFPTLAATYAPGGRRPHYGDVFQNPALADTYAKLAQDGPQAFYEGEIARRIVAFSEAEGGRFSARDFADHEATWVDPVSSGYRGYDVWELPPNGQGIATLQILNLLEHFDIGAMAPNSPEQLHLFVEAKKLAFEDRAVYYADPAHADVPVEWLISKEYAAERVKRIDPKRASNDVGAGVWDGSKDTVYLTAADGDGNMISLIQSIYHGWGSHIAPDGLGFALQNRGTAFSLDPKHRNALAPHKRPFHTIIPAFVTRGGRPVFSFGVMGGDFQPQGQSQVLMNLIDFGMSPQQAGEQPRIRHHGSSEPSGGEMAKGGMISFERGFDDEVREALRAMGHVILPRIGANGGYQGIWREEAPLRYFGGADPRKDGCAAGF